MSVCKSLRCAASGQITCRPLWHLCSLPALSPSPFWRQSLHRFLSFQVSFAYFWISCKWNQIVFTFSKSGFVAKPNLGPLAHMQLKPLRVVKGFIAFIASPKEEVQGPEPWTPDGLQGSTFKGQVKEGGCGSVICAQLMHSSLVSWWWDNRVVSTGVNIIELQTLVSLGAMCSWSSSS